MILTEELNYRDHAQTKDLVWKISRMHNLLRFIKESEQEHPPQESSNLILVWTNFRTIVANSLNKTFENKSEPSGPLHYPDQPSNELLRN